MGCPYTSTTDFSAFLVDSPDPEWVEFRHHYLQCQPCTVLVAEWTQLETALRSLENDTVDMSSGHPTVEQLAQFQRRPELLSQQAQRTIQHHLGACPACSEEMTSIESFNFSLLDDKASPANSAAEHTTPVHVQDREHISRPFTARLTGLIKSWEFERLQSIFFHPAFTYAVILLLCIPTLRYYTEPTGPVSTRSPALPPPTRAATPSVLSAPLTDPQDSLSPDDPAVLAQAVFAKYTASYETRDLQSLGRVWAMRPDQRQEIGQLFQEVRGLAVLINIKEAKSDPTGAGVVVTFDQAVTLLRGQDAFAARGPFSYTAELRQSTDSGEWMLRNVQELEN